MRRAILAVAVIFSASTAVMASTAGLELAGEPGASGAAIQKREIAPEGVAAGGQRGFLGGDVILAKGDKSGTGGGHGGHKGEKKGGHHGKQKEGEHNKS